MTGAVRIVLVNPSHPGNIGAVARAMKTMGLSELWLVEPRLFPHADATTRAAGADDLLASARICDSLDEALAGCRLVIGSSARPREIRWPLLSPRAAAVQLVEAMSGGPVAMLFGRERTGLSNDELDRCQALVSIPTVADFASLNLASAVQVLAYEIRVAGLSGTPDVAGAAGTGSSRPATADDLEGFFAHLERTLWTVEFLDPARPSRVLRRLRRMFARARPEEDEVRILRGILTQVDKHADGTGD